MAGMEGLGRLLNVVPIAAGRGLKLRDCSAITFVCTGQDTFTLTEASSFGGSYSNLATISRLYWSTATNGTAAWQKFTQTAAATVIPGTTTGITTANTVAFEVLTSQLADPFNYVKVTPSASGLVTAILHDLTVQRGPANLAIVSA